MSFPADLAVLARPGIFHHLRGEARCQVAGNWIRRVADFDANIKRILESRFAANPFASTVVAFAKPAANYRDQQKGGLIIVYDVQ